MGKKIIIFLLLCYLIKDNVFAAVRINEIYPAPPSGETEWIELYNNEDKEIDLIGYTLTDFAQNKITLETKSISPFGFILATCSNVLNNSGDTVFLKNNLNEIIETVIYSETFNSEKTYARCPDGSGNWFTLTTTTKKSSNDTACLVLTPTVIPTPIITPTEISTTTVQPTPIPSSTSEVQEPTPTIQTSTITNSPDSYQGIFIFEVMVNPESGEKEWVELFNNNDFSVSLNNWYVDDLENGGNTPKSLSLTITEKSYRVFELTSSVFNNDGDQVRLLDFDKNLKDSFEYGNSIQGKTWGRINLDNDSFCLQEPSKNAANSSCLNPSPVSSPAKTVSPQSASTSSPVISHQLPIGIYQSTADYQSTYSGPTPQVLGESGYQPMPEPQNNTVKSLSFLSLSYSLLTIASVLIKMRING